MQPKIRHKPNEKGGAMKVPISDYLCLDLDAPVLPAEQVEVDGRILWRVWYKHCEEYHYHGPAPGHRIAHCQRPGSPYDECGYNLARADTSR